MLAINPQFQRRKIITFRRFQKHQHKNKSNFYMKSSLTLTSKLNIDFIWCYNIILHEHEASFHSQQFDIYLEQQW